MERLRKMIGGTLEVGEVGAMGVLWERKIISVDLNGVIMNENVLHYLVNYIESLIHGIENYQIDSIQVIKEQLMWLRGYTTALMMMSESERNVDDVLCAILQQLISERE